MQQLLDREMPVHVSKRRRLFGWWWLLLPLAGYSTWEWINAASNLPTETAHPVAQNTQTQSLTANNYPTNANTITTQSAERPAEPSEASPTQSLEVTSTPPNTHLSDPKSSEQLVEKVIVDALNSEITNQQNAETAEALAPKMLLTNTLNAPIKSIENQVFTTNIEPKTTQTNLLKPIKSRVLKPWTFGAITALTSEQFTNVNGFSTGVSVDWAFAQKWGLRSGLMYQIYTPEENHRPVASVQTSDYAAKIAPNLLIIDAYSGMELGTPGTNSFVDSLSDNILIPLNRIQRLEVPISLFWQPNSQVKVLGGLSVSRTLSSRADRQNYSGQYLLQLTNQTAQDDASRLVANQLGDWNAVATLGIGWAIAQQFEIGFSTRLPFSKQPSYAPIPQTGGPTTLPGPPEPKRTYTPTYAMHGILFF